MISERPAVAGSGGGGRALPQVLSDHVEAVTEAEANRVSRLSRQALGGHVGLVALVVGDREVVVGCDGEVPDLESDGQWFPAGSRQGTVRLAERGVPDRTWVVAYAGVPLEVQGRVLVALVGVLRQAPWACSADDLARLGEFALLSAELLRTRIREEGLERLEELAPQLAEPLGVLSDLVRRTADLAERPGDPRLPRLADVLRLQLQTVEHLAAELDDTAAQARPAAPSGSPSFDLCRVVRAARDRALSLDQSADLKVDLPDVPILVRWPADGLERALDRILRAAVHHADPGSAVQVRLDVSDRARVEVAIPGRGMPLPDLLRVVGSASTGPLSPASISLESDRVRLRGPGVEAHTDAGGTFIELTVPLDSPTALGPGRNRANGS